MEEEIRAESMADPPYDDVDRMLDVSRYAQVRRS